MITQQLISDIQQLCPILFEDVSFGLFVFSKERNVIFGSNTVRNQEIEETALVLKTINGLGKTGALPSHHALNQFDIKEELVFIHWNTENNSLQFALFIGKSKLQIFTIAKNIIDRAIHQELRRVKIAQMLEEKNKQILALSIEKEELNTYTLEQLGQATREICERYFSFPIIISLTVLQAWINSKKDILFIEKQLIDAIELKLYLNNSPQVIQLDLSDFTFEFEPIHTPKPESTIRNERVIHLLNRYEESALLISQSKGEINSKNIADKLIPAISPPAISDALKKNKKAIEAAFIDFPDKWRLIRSHLRPLIQIDEKIAYQDQSFNSSYAS